MLSSLAFPGQPHLVQHNEERGRAGNGPRNLSTHSGTEDPSSVPHSTSTPHSLRLSLARNGSLGLKSRPELDRSLTGVVRQTMKAGWDGLPEYRRRPLICSMRPYWGQAQLS